MATEPLRIVCGNSECRVALLIKDPEKLRDAKCPRCGYINPIDPVSKPFNIDDNEDRTVLGNFTPPPLPPIDKLGWLVTKDELMRTTTYTLRLGSNSVGRRSDKRPSDIQIDTKDEYMSRPNCTIIARIGKLNTAEFILQDGGIVNGQWKQSTNGTYINGKEPGLSDYDKVYLEDGDTIQIGETKLVFKMGSHNLTRQQATQAVEDMDYEPTIISFKSRSQNN